MMMMMMFTVMRGGRLRWRCRLSRGRGRVRCVNAGLSDKAEDGSQKQNMFCHRLLLNTVKNAKFRKRFARLAKKRACWSATPSGPSARGERPVPRNER